MIRIVCRDACGRGSLAFQTVPGSPWGRFFLSGETRKAPSCTREHIMQRTLIPIGRWKITVDAKNDQTTFLLSGQTFSDTWEMNQSLQTVQLTTDQAHELVFELNWALLKAERQRAADLDRAAEHAG
jgi:hypothetical protein